MADESAAAAPAASTTRPEKPDESAFKEEAAKLEKELADLKSKTEAINKKLDLTKHGKNPRRAELIEELKKIRLEQNEGKTTRGAKIEQLKRLDEQLKIKKQELKATRDIMPAKDEADLDTQVKKLDEQINSGRLSLIEERKTVEEISKLRRSRKQFSVLNEKQKSVDEITAKIQAIKAEAADPKAKELSDKYSTLQAELDVIKAEEDDVWKNINSLRDEKTKLRNEDKAKWEELKARKDSYYKAKKEFSNWEWEQKRKARERQKAERERFEKERKMERAQKILAEASDRAYLDEIRRANSLLYFFDPSSVPEKAPLQASSGLEAQADRKVDDSGIKGVKLIRKEDRGEDYLPAVKKGKKGKKPKAAGTPKDDKAAFKCPPSVMEDCSFIGIEPPLSADDIPGVVEKVKAKLDHWKSDQDAQTKRNIEKAQKEIEKIEAEEAKEKEDKKSASGSATPNGDATDATQNGDKAVDDIAKDIAEKATLEKKEEVAAA